jgi:uncharacterized lipoprotein YbaY
LVSGEVMVEGARGLSGARVRVALEDVSRADAPATIIAEELMRDVTYDPTQGRPLPFRLDGEIPDERASYVVRVHVDVDGDGEISQGDFISMESYPVLTHGNPDRVTVRVHEIT